MSDIDGKRNKSKLGSISKNDDRLSDLPDEILYKILSFIPTKDAVSTSVLSTKWKYLYSASDKCFPRILEGCPSLEELYLKLVSVEGAKYLDLSSPSLRLLSLWYCPPIVLDNPNLVHLKSVYVGQMTVKNLKSLAAAELGDRPSCPSSWTNLFNEFLNVKILSLSCKIWEDCQIPIFGNLTELEFVTLYRTQLKICALILDRAPCLAKLRVYMGRMESDDIFEYHRPIHSKLNTLREVEIVNCQGFECQMSFVEYLLQVGEALKVFKFMFKMPGGKSSKDWPYSAMKRLAICPRPPACKILLP